MSPVRVPIPNMVKSFIAKTLITAEVEELVVSV